MKRSERVSAIVKILSDSPNQSYSLGTPSLTAKQKQNLLYPLGFKEILLVVQSIKM